MLDNNQQNLLNASESFNGSQSPGIIDSSSSPMPIKMATAHTSTAQEASYGSNNGSVKTSPIIISQPVRFSGNRLMHMPPQIIHVSTF